MEQETLENAKHWFESMGYHADIAYGSLHLYLDGMSVELSESEIEARAEQWINNLNRQD